MSLREYKRKRHFKRTPEPAGKVAAARYTKPIPSAGDPPPAAAAPPAPVAAPRPRSWTSFDAGVCLLALCVLVLSLWAIRWVAAIGRV